MPEQTERIVIRGLDVDLVVEENAGVTGVRVAFGGGSFEPISDEEYLYIQPVGYEPARADASLSAGGDLNILATDGGIAAAVINGSVRADGIAGPEIREAQAASPAYGSIKLIVGPGIKSIILYDCYGTYTGPDGQSHAIDGHRERISLIRPTAGSSAP